MTAYRRIGIAVVAGAFGIWATAALGVWQLRRASAKETLQAQLEAAARAGPVEPDREALSAPASLVHRHLRFRGRWVPDAVVYLDNRPQAGQAGFYVLMPLVIDGPVATEVIVNRGWTPRNLQDRARIGAFATPDGVVDVVGVALPEEPRLMELQAPAEKSLKSIWQNFDFDAYARASGRRPLPLVLRQDGGDTAGRDGLARDWPDRGGALQSQIDRHHGYAFQWFALCATLAALLCYHIVRTLRHDRTHAR